MCVGAPSGLPSRAQASGWGRHPVTPVLAHRQPRDGLHLRGERCRGGERHEPSLPRGRAVHLWLQPRRTPQGPAAGLAVGRLRRQHRLRLPLCQGVRGRARAGAHPRQGLLRERAHPHELAQQRGRPQGECCVLAVSFCSPPPRSDCPCLSFSLFPLPALCLFPAAFISPHSDFPHIIFGLSGEMCTPHKGLPGCP